jgi:hypothetical protein
MHALSVLIFCSMWTMTYCRRRNFVPLQYIDIQYPNRKAELKKELQQCFKRPDVAVEITKIVLLLCDHLPLDDQNNFPIVDE